MPAAVAAIVVTQVENHRIDSLAGKEIKKGVSMAFTVEIRHYADVFGMPSCSFQSTEKRRFSERKRDFVGQHFRARGYFVSTVGRDEEVIRAYIGHQEIENRRSDQMKLM